MNKPRTVLSLIAAVSLFASTASAQVNARQGAPRDDRETPLARDAFSVGALVAVEEVNRQLQYRVSRGVAEGASLQEFHSRRERMHRTLRTAQRDGVVTERERVRVSAMVEAIERLPDEYRIVRGARRLWQWS